MICTIILPFYSNSAFFVAPPTHTSIAGLTLATVSVRIPSHPSETPPHEASPPEKVRSYQFPVTVPLPPILNVPVSAELIDSVDRVVVPAMLWPPAVVTQVAHPKIPEA